MTRNQFEKGLTFARDLDHSNPLKDYREKFYIPETNMIYLDGNSLGRLPLRTREIIQQVTDRQWGTRLIRSWNEGWYGRSAEVSKKLAKVIGAGDEEVIICDSTSINLYKLAFAALKKQSGRKKIISDDLNFPTDLYVLQGIVDQMNAGHELVLAHSKDDLTVDMQTLDEVIDQDTALVVLSLVAFKSAFMYDMKAVNEIAHKNGALILWDLSHAAGVLPIELSKNHTDLAVGCTYKYLNGGPGSPAYLFVRNELQDDLVSPVWGWFGDKDPFSFNLQYEAAKGISKFLVGTPPVLSLEAITPGLDITLDAGMESIRDKSVLQSEYLLFLFEKYLKDLGFLIGSPLDPEQRGSHISIQHPEAFRICKALIEPVKNTVKVIPDFRTPDNIRIGITPLYTSFADIFKAVERIREIITSNEYLLFTDVKDAVT